MSLNVDDTTQIADSERVDFLETPEHPGVVALTAYWNEKRGSRATPDRQDIVPSEIVRLLPNIQIAEVLDGGRDFRIRLFGTALVAMFGVEITGRRLSELRGHSKLVTNAEAARGRWFDILGRAHARLRPVFAAGFLVNTVHRDVRWHAVSAPLTVGGSQGAQLLSGIFFVEKR